MSANGDTRSVVVDPHRRAMFAARRALYVALLTVAVLCCLAGASAFASLLVLDLCSGMVSLAVIVFLASKIPIRAWLRGLVRVVRRATALRWDCQECGKRLESDQAWICGSCNRENTASSFLYRCGHCKAVPKAFECYHCSTLIFFSKDRDDRCIARIVPGPLPGETLEEMERRHRREIGEMRHTLSRLEHTEAIRTLEAKLKPAEKVDQKEVRETWMHEQIEGLGYTVGAVIETIGEKKRLMERIAADTSLTIEEKAELISLVNHHCDNLSDDIRYGRATAQ
jgi:hypothetical protein